MSIRENIRESWRSGEIPTDLARGFIVALAALVLMVFTAKPWWWNFVVISGAWCWVSIIRALKRRAKKVDKAG